MNTVVTDRQTVGETEGTLFEMLQQGPVSALLTVRNTGSNTMNYRFQEYNGTTWEDLDEAGDPLNDTLTAGEVKSLTVETDYPRVRMLGYASGGATLDFSVMRYIARASGGALPMLSY